MYKTISICEECGIQIRYQSRLCFPCRNEWALSQSNPHEYSLEQEFYDDTDTVPKKNNP